MKIGLLLIGGSIKGLAAHAGVVDALREMKLKPDVILGASAGSVVGSFLATNMPSEEIFRRVTALTAKDFLDPISRWKLLYEFIFQRAAHFTGFVKGDQSQRYIAEALTGKDDFSKTEIPFYVAATDLATHKVVLFNTGSISEKVRASTAVPVLFCPKVIDGRMYTDGALAKEFLPEVFLEVAPDLDLIVVSNMSYEKQVAEQEMVESSPLPIFEIVRSVLSIRIKTKYPVKIGKTRIIYLKPGIRTTVDIFNPDVEKAKSIFEEAKRFTIHHLGRTVKTLSKKKS